MLSYAFDAQLRTPEELAARYQTLGAWAGALLTAGAGRVDVWSASARTPSCRALAAYAATLARRSQSLSA